MALVKFIFLSGILSGTSLHKRSDSDKGNFCTRATSCLLYTSIAERLDYDFINQPDLAQTFVVTCALMNIPFRFSGLQSLKIKETDRITCLLYTSRCV